MHLDISNNNLNDDCCTEIIQALSRPAEDFDSDDKLPTDFGTVSYGHSSVDAVMKVHNHSITDLNLGYNELSENAAEALINMIKNNAVLHTLHLNCCTSISPIYFRKFTNALRLYNSTLQEISLADTPLTVKTMEYISRIMQSNDTCISKLDFSNCGLRHQHLNACLKNILLSKHLTHLILSGNKLSDTGAAILATIIEGQKQQYSITTTTAMTNTSGSNSINDQPTTAVCLPPLKVLDVSNCDLKPEGCKVILVAISTRDVPFQLLNLSNNIFGSDNIDGFEALSRCAIYDLRMNMCNIASHGAAILFQYLATTTSNNTNKAINNNTNTTNNTTNNISNNNINNINNRLSHMLKVLCLSGNEIADSAMISFGLLLQSNNCSLEFIDMGFNLITDHSMDILKKSSAVTSTDSPTRKLYGLTVNFIGNRCDPYIVGPPGYARSKYTFDLGTRPNLLDPLNKGYSHVPSISRANYFVRKELDNIYRASYPQQTINSIE